MRHRIAMLTAALLFILALPAAASAYPPGAAWHEQGNSSTYLHLGNAEWWASERAAGNAGGGAAWQCEQRMRNYGLLWSGETMRWVGSVNTFRRSPTAVMAEVHIYLEPFGRAPFECVYRSEIQGTDTSPYVSVGPYFQFERFY